MGAGMMSWSPGSMVTPAGIFCTALSLAGELLWHNQPCRGCSLGLLFTCWL
jgi:hypothetical protein